MSSEPLLVVLRVRADDAGRIGAVLEALVAQEGVDFRAVIVDEGAVPECAEALARLADPRCLLLRNPTVQPAWRARARALQSCAAPYVVEVPTRGVLLPGALAQLHAACVAAPEVGLAHCAYYTRDATGQVRRDAFRSQRRRFLARFGDEGDVRRQLLADGDVLGPLRIYRRAAYAVMAQQTPPGRRGTELAALIAIAARFELGFVPAYLYCRQQAPPSPPVPWWRVVGDAVGEARACARVLAAGRGLFTQARYPAGRLLAGRVARAVGVPRIGAIVEPLRRLPRRIQSRVLTPIGERIYYALVERFSGHAGRLLPRTAAPAAGRARRIAYYIWHFPVLSQTFVNRELAALKRAGVDFDIIAEGAEDDALADHNAALLRENASYLDLDEAGALRRARRRFLARRPFTYVRVLLFAVLSRHMQYKRYGADVAAFDKALLLAAALEDKEVSHVHSPWADQCALLALMASRLAGISYSVQARAHEIHRHTYQFGLADRLRAAAFVVTNTRYNEAALRAVVGPEHARRIHVIHNGIDLERFVPAGAAGARGGPVRILCVARLIEQKGLTHLLEACALLAQRGLDFVCDVIGGPEEPLYTTYHLELKRLHRRLALGERVRFVGVAPLAVVLTQLRESDLFVLPCVIAADGSRDITPNALKEAMAMGLPVVSTTVGGVPEIVEHGVSGLVVGPGDAVALADAMEVLIRDPELRAMFGVAARARIEVKFDITVNVRRYVELFAGVARGAAPVPAPRAPSLVRAPGD
jgi:glycosyltransferase involved in cell wall biosynthesis